MQPPPASSPRPRLSPLAKGLLIASIFGLSFGLLAAAIGEGPVPQLDRRIALAMRDLSEGQPGVRRLMVILTHTGGIAALTVLALGLTIWEAWRRRWAAALACVLIPLGGALFDLFLKNSFDRDRPPLEWRDPAVSETNESFPSGHSMGSMVGFGMLGFLLLGLARRRSVRAAIVIALGTLILAIGFSRIYLRAHWFSDVVGGFTIGFAWLGLGLGWFAHWVQRRESRDPKP